MKKALIAVLILCLMLLLLPAAAAGAPFKDASYGNFTYVDTGENVIITGYNGPGGTVNIPDTISGKPITGISNYVFLQRKSVTGVHIPNTVTSIGYQAFWESGLTSVALPDACTRLEEGAFAGCTKLGAFSVGTGNTAFTCVDGVLLSKDQKTLVQYPAGKSSTSYTVPSGVTEIGKSAFYACHKLTSLYLPSGLTTIDKGAFDGCNWVVSMSIPEGVTDIPDYAFGGCHSLKTISLPSSITSIGESAFTDCLRLTSISIPDKVTSIGRNAFFYCGDLASITIGSGLTSIDPTALLTGNSLAEIMVATDNSAFMSASNVLYNKDKTILIKYAEAKTDTSFIIPDGVTKITEHAFESCQNITGSVTLPDSVTEIGKDAFNGCRNIKSIQLGSGLTTLGIEAFSGCRSMKEILMPEGVASLPDGTFSNCEGLERVYFMGNAPAVDEGAFYEATGMMVYYREGKTGFTPVWQGFQTAIFDPGTTYTVAFNLNGATSAAPAAQTLFQGVKAEKPQPDPVRTGFAFGGWYQEPACINVWDFATLPTVNMTLYAKWAQAPSVKLAALTVTPGSWNRPFTPDTSSYTITLGEDDKKATVTPTKAYDGAKSTIDGKEIAGKEVPVANNRSVTVKIKLTYGKQSKVYTLVIRRNASTNSALLSLKSSVPGLTPAFTPGHFDYTLNLDEHTDRVRLTADAASPLAKVYSPDRTYFLKNDQTKIVTIRVRSQKGTNSYYHVKITRDASSNADLSSIKTNSRACSLNPDFNAATLDYTITLPANMKTVTISSKAADRLSKVATSVTINGVTQKTNRVTLLNGQSATVTVSVTAQSKATKTYTITVTRPAI